MRFLLLLLSLSVLLAGCSTGSPGSGGPAEQSKNEVITSPEPIIKPEETLACTTNALTLDSAEVTDSSYYAVQQLEVMFKYMLEEKYGFDPLAEYMQSKSSDSDVPDHFRLSDQVINTGNHLKENAGSTVAHVDHLLDLLVPAVSSAKNSRSLMASYLAEVKLQLLDSYKEGRSFVKNKSSVKDYYDSKPFLEWHAHRSKQGFAENLNKVKNYSACLSEYLKDPSKANVPFEDRTQGYRDLIHLLEVYTLRDEVISGKITKQNAVSKMAQLLEAAAPYDTKTEPYAAYRFLFRQASLVFKETKEND